MPAAKKLIEVALPLDAINKASAREKSICHGRPVTSHIWIHAINTLRRQRAVEFKKVVANSIIYLHQRSASGLTLSVSQSSPRVGRTCQPRVNRL